MDMRNCALNENVFAAGSSYVQKSRSFVCVCVWKIACEIVV